MKRSSIVLTIALLATTALSGCGGTGTASPATSTAPPSSSPTAAAGQATPRPGVTGLIAAVSGSTRQVQSSTAQTAVTWSPSTRITSTSTATLAAVRVGECLSARPAYQRGGTSAPGSPSSGTPSGSATSSSSSSPNAPAVVQAATVTISAAHNGSCTGASLGGGGGFGGRRGTATGTPTTGETPGTAGSHGAYQPMRGTAGLVTAVSGDTITVQPTVRAATTSGSTAPAAAGASATTASGVAGLTPVTVRVSGSTVYTRTSAGTVADIATGRCVTAIGKADDTGAVAATTLMLSPSTNGSCQAGFGRPGHGSGSSAS